MATVEHPTGIHRDRALSADALDGSARAFLDVVNRIVLLEAQARNSAPLAVTGGLPTSASPPAPAIPGCSDRLEIDVRPRCVS